MRILVAMDSFKGSVSADDAVRYLAEGLGRVSGLDIDPCPLADGGEGTGALVERYLGGRRVEAPTVDSYGTPRSGWWILWGRTAVVESAVGSGFVAPDRRPASVWHTTSRGTGQLVRQAGESGVVDHYVITLGGTGSVDGGMGFLEALGTEFYGAGGRPLAGVAANLGHVRRIRPPRHRWSLTGLYDTFVPLLGPNGAVRLYGPQKGVTPDDADALEAAIAQFARVLEESTEIAGLASLPGAGAAGGIGLAIYALGGRMEAGATTVARWVDLPRRVAEADWVITGEGRLDAQSLLGKVVGTVVQLAASRSKPVVAVAGSHPVDLAPFYAAGLTSALALVPGPMALEEAVSRTPELLRQMGETLGRWIVASVGL